MTGVLPITYWRKRLRENEIAPECKNCGKRMVKSDQKRKGKQRWICYGEEGVVCNRLVTEEPPAINHRGGAHSKRPAKDELAALIKTMTYEQVAQRFEVSKGTVRGWVKDYQLKSAPGGTKVAKIKPETVKAVVAALAEKTLSMRQIAEEHGISLGAVNDIAYRRNKKSETEALKKQMGMTERQIAVREVKGTPEARRIGRPFGGSGWHSIAGIFNARAFW